MDDCRIIRDVDADPWDACPTAGKTTRIPPPPAAPPQDTRAVFHVPTGEVWIHRGGQFVRAVDDDGRTTRWSVRDAAVEYLTGVVLEPTADGRLVIDAAVCDVQPLLAVSEVTPPLKNSFRHGGSGDSTPEGAGAQHSQPKSFSSPSDFAKACSLGNFLLLHAQTIFDFSVVQPIFRENFEKAVKLDWSTFLRSLAKKGALELLVVGRMTAATQQEGSRDGGSAASVASFHEYHSAVRTPSWERAGRENIPSASPSAADPTPDRDDYFAASRPSISSNEKFDFIGQVSSLSVFRDCGKSTTKTSVAAGPSVASTFAASAASNTSGEAVFMVSRAVGTSLTLLFAPIGAPVNKKQPVKSRASSDAVKVLHPAPDLAQRHHCRYDRNKPASQTNKRDMLMLGAGETMMSTTSRQPPCSYDEDELTYKSQEISLSASDYGEIIRSQAGGTKDHRTSDLSQSESYGVDSSYARPRGSASPPPPHQPRAVPNKKTRTSGEHKEQSDHHNKSKRTLVSLKVLPPPTDEERCRLLVQELGCPKGYVCNCKQLVDEDGRAGRNRHVASARPPVPWPVSPSVENAAREQHQRLNHRKQQDNQESHRTHVQAWPEPQMTKGLLRHKKHQEQQENESDEASQQQQQELTATHTSTGKTRRFDDWDWSTTNPDETTVTAMPDDDASSSGQFRSPDTVQGTSAFTASSTQTPLLPSPPQRATRNHGQSVTPYHDESFPATGVIKRDEGYWRDDGGRRARRRDDDAREQRDFTGEKERSKGASYSSPGTGVPEGESSPEYGQQRAVKHKKRIVQTVDHQGPRKRHSTVWTMPSSPHSHAYQHQTYPRPRASSSYPNLYLQARDNAARIHDESNAAEDSAEPIAERSVRAGGSNRSPVLNMGQCGGRGPCPEVREHKIVRGEVNKHANVRQRGVQTRFCNMTDENSVSDLLDKYIKPSSVRESKAHHQNAALLHDSHATYTTHIPVPIIVATDKEAALALSRLSQHYAKSLEYFINETADAEGKGHDLLKEDASVHEASRIRASFSGEPGGNAEVKSESSGVSVKELPPALAPNEVISAHRSPQDSTVLNKKKPQSRSYVAHQEEVAEFEDDAQISLVFYTLFLFTIAMALTFCLWYFLQGPGSVGSWWPWSSDAVTSEVKVAPGEGIVVPDKASAAAPPSAATAAGGDTAVGAAPTSQVSVPADTFVAKIAKKTKAEADHETL